MPTPSGWHQLQGHGIVIGLTAAWWRKLPLIVVPPAPSEVKLAMFRETPPERYPREVQRQIMALRVKLGPNVKAPSQSAPC